MARHQLLQKFGWDEFQDFQADTPRDFQCGHGLHVPGLSPRSQHPGKRCHFTQSGVGIGRNAARDARKLGALHHAVQTDCWATAQGWLVERGWADHLPDVLNPLEEAQAGDDQDLHVSWGAVGPIWERHQVFVPWVCFQKCMGQNS